MTTELDELLLPSVKESLHRLQINYRVVECDDSYSDTAAFCEHYGFSLKQAANTLLVTSKKVTPSVQSFCIVQGSSRLDVNRKVKALLDVKRASFADAQLTLELTGMMIGGVTPFGIETLPIYVDPHLLSQQEIVLGGGNRSSKVIIPPQELIKLPGSQVVDGLTLNEDIS